MKMQLSAGAAISKAPEPAVPSPEAFCHRPFQRRALLGLWLLSAAATLIPASPAAAGVDAKVFPFLRYTRQMNVPVQSHLSKDEFNRGADLFGLVTYKEWRVLSEILVDNAEADLERLQFGRWVGDNTLLWVGRYHTPSAYWDMVYHHSPFLQTSVSRPQIMQYEDNGGVIPTHIWGLRADQTITTGTGEWQIHIGVGEAPTVTADGLQAIHALDPKGINDRLATVAAVSYLPDTFSANELGAFISSIQMPGSGVGASEIRQITAGAYANWTFGTRLHLITSIFRVHTNPQGTTGGAHGFFAGYAQGELAVSPRWRAFLRYEGAASITHDTYLNLLPQRLAHNAAIGGVRFDVTPHQALSLEAGHLEYENAHPNRFMLQWSAMFP